AATASIAAAAACRQVGFQTGSVVATSATTETAITTTTATIYPAVSRTQSVKILNGVNCPAGATVLRNCTAAYVVNAAGKCKKMAAVLCKNDSPPPPPLHPSPPPPSPPSPSPSPPPVQRSPPPQPPSPK
ncbi:hypothetical protein Agub_g15655, partial [Astrephomene gubernaculifera]